MVAGNLEEPRWSKAFNTHSPCVYAAQKRSTAKLGRVLQSLSWGRPDLTEDWSFVCVFIKKLSVSKVQVLGQMQLKSARKMSLIWFLMPWQSPLSASLAQVTDRVLLPRNIAAFKDNSWPHLSLIYPCCFSFSSINAFKYLALFLLLIQQHDNAAQLCSDSQWSTPWDSSAFYLLTWGSNASHAEQTTVSSAPGWRPRILHLFFIITGNYTQRGYTQKGITHVCLYNVQHASYCLNA